MRWTQPEGASFGDGEDGPEPGMLRIALILTASKRDTGPTAARN